VRDFGSARIHVHNAFIVSHPPSSHEHRDYNESSTSKAVGKSVDANAAGIKLKIRCFNKWQSCLLDRPNLVDNSRFRNPFWGDTIPFEQGIPETVMSFRSSGHAQ